MNPRNLRSESLSSKIVSIHAEGIYLADKDEKIPLWAGAMHYWRHSPEDWGACLDAVKAMGLRLVDTYVPWGVHETAQDAFDFGQRDAHLDVARFVRLAAERELYVIVRPGPHINAELTFFGLPERIVWNRDCQARAPRNHPVILPMVPKAFPVPSYASNVFHDEVALWFDACGKVLSPLLYPRGPIVMMQVDNEGALYFRDGPYDSDYHPDAIALFRNFLRSKYATVAELREAWGEPNATFRTVSPPVRFDATESRDLARHLDWMEFHEHLIVHAMGRFAQSLENADLSSVPTYHNFPPGESTTPLNAERFKQAVDFVGLDYYHAANPRHHRMILRRTTELAVHSEGFCVPAYGAEVGAGFSPIFPPLDDKDTFYTLMCALAYGLRGFNLYMAVDRDRWVGAPIDVHGIPRRVADEYHALLHALARVKFTTLFRRAPVRLVVPRALRRLARATHAFGPVTPSAFNIAGLGLIDSCLEDDFGLGNVAPIAGESLLRAFEEALLTRGIPFAYAGGEGLEMSIGDASWIVCATAGGIEQELFAQLRKAQKNGIVVTMGPNVPNRDGSMRNLDVPHDVQGFHVVALEDPAEADSLVARWAKELHLPAYPVDIPDVYVAIHEDAKGTPKIVFVMNPTDKIVTATVELGNAVNALEDLLPRAHMAARIERTEPHSRAFVVEVLARTVRMFSVT
ncbi:MAG: beta-galactosidase [Polyangiaceae bacterium]|nr:beta-galactosidase [Polyangiaceae bacterium]